MASASGTVKYGLNRGLLGRDAHGVAMLKVLHYSCIQENIATINYYYID